MSFAEIEPILPVKDIPSTKQLCDLTFKDIHFHVKTGGCNKSKQHILHGISGVVRSGELVAIMGPSGSGKTTLLSILAQRAAAGKVTGSVRINGENPKHLFRKYGAYVAQEDILYADLTVRETLLYAALFRLPCSISYKEKNRIVDEILDTLGLTHVQHSRIGGTLLRGISGGEKRRVSIGIELITNPSLLLADEVTSGLDSHAAASVMDILLQMTKRGTTVITTIHQPSSQIYQRFDQLLLLSKGSNVYFGPASGVIDYFSSFGFDIPAGWNPADYFLDVISQTSNHKTICGQYQNSELKSRLDGLLNKHHDNENLYDNTNSNNIPDTGCFLSQSTPWIYQFAILSHRNIKRMLKNPIFLLQLLLSYILSAAMMGALFSDLKSNTENQLTLCISFMLDVFGINAFLAVNTFMQDSAIFRREYASGYYSPSAFYISRVVCSMPLNFIVCAIYTLVIFYWVGLADRDISQYPTLLILNYITMETFLALNEIFGVMFTRYETAVLFAGVANTIQMLTNGVFINYPNIPKYLKWTYWASFLTYTLNGVMLLQYSDTAAGEQWLAIFGTQITEISTCIYALLGFWAGIRTLGFIAIKLSSILRK